MRILVTGSDGVIGNELLPMLAGNEVLCVDKKQGPHHDLGTASLGFIEEFEPEVVYHLAASFERAKESESMHAQNYNDNMLASLRLLQILPRCPVKQFVFASSYLVYNPKYYLARFGVLSEDSEVLPRNLCGAYKFYVERELEYIRTTLMPGLRVASARIFRVYGKNSKDFVSRCLREKREQAVWNKYSVFDYIHARDVAYALWKLVETEANGVYNVGTGMGTRLEDMVRLTGTAYRELESDEPFEQHRACIEKLTHQTNWRPEIDIVDGVKELKEYYK